MKFGLISPRGHVIYLWCLIRGKYDSLLLTCYSVIKHNTCQLNYTWCIVCIQMGHTDSMVCLLYLCCDHLLLITYSCVIFLYLKKVDWPACKDGCLKCDICILRRYGVNDIMARITVSHNINNFIMAVANNRDYLNCIAVWMIMNPV